MSISRFLGQSAKSPLGLLCGALLCMALYGFDGCRPSEPPRVSHRVEHSVDPATGFDAGGREPRHYGADGAPDKGSFSRAVSAGVRPGVDTHSDASASEGLTP
ncbi:MAG: hypothetical protein OXR73_29750 [Myxococcales bacterium]|nr:hypothetical protein [Myxococcales bacterium]